MEKVRIFVSAYACEPGLGSEIGVGWHWVLEMSKYFDLWVLTRSSNRSAIESWFEKNDNVNGIKFIYFDLPKWARFWKRGLRGVRLYYNLWQLCSDNVVKRTMTENNIKVFHHLTYGNALWRVSRFGQKQFFIWGPVGGLETIPDDFVRSFSFLPRCVETFRRLVVASVSYNPGFIARCRNANLILCKTEFTLDRIPVAYASKAELFTDVAADISNVRYTCGERNDTVTEFITVGRLDAWRGFDLVVEAFAMAVKQNDNIRLNIVGDGKERSHLLALIDKYKLGDKISVAGSVSMEVYKEMMNRADVVVNAALKEGAVTVSFDAMAMGKPLVCLDTAGFSRYFTNDYAVVIPLDKRSAVIENIKMAMLRLTDPFVRSELGKKAGIAAQSCSWQKRGEIIRDMFVRSFTINDSYSGNK